MEHIDEVITVLGESGVFHPDEVSYFYKNKTPESLYIKTPRLFRFFMFFVSVFPRFFVSVFFNSSAISFSSFLNINSIFHLGFDYSLFINPLLKKLFYLR